MIRWRKARRVATFEFLSTVKRLGYVLTTFGLPVFMALQIGVVAGIGAFAARKQLTVPSRAEGIVDGAGVLGLAPGESRVDFRLYPDLESAKRALLGGEVDTIHVLASDYLETGRVDVVRREGVGPGQTSDAPALRELLIDRLLADRVDPAWARRIEKPIETSKVWIATESGELRAYAARRAILRLVVPFACTYALVFSFFLTSSYVLQATAAEKESKLAEVLLAAARPDEILAGKLCGLGAAGLLQAAMWLGVVASAAKLLGRAAGLGVSDVPWPAVAVGLAFFVVGYLFLGALVIGSGSLGGTARESQQLGSIWLMLILIPSTLLARILSWIPFTAPAALTLRMAVEPSGVAWWEIAGSLVVMGLAGWLAVSVGARLFRVGLMLTGARPSLREILHQARLSA